MIKDLSPKLVAAVAAINQKSREAFVAEQKALQEKQTAKQLGKMPGVAAPKADAPAHANAKKMAEEAGGTTPKTEKEKKLAAMRPPANKITHGDVLHGRGVRKEEAEQVDETIINGKIVNNKIGGDMATSASHQASTTMKHIPNASPALKKAAKDIKPGVSGYRDRIAMLKAGGVKEEAEPKKIDAFDYKTPRKPQDMPNRKSGDVTMTGHDVKKISTGTVYTKRFTKEAAEQMSRAAKGHEKYGKEGMQALAKAGKEGKALDPVRKKYDKYEEAVSMDTPGNSTHQCAIHVKSEQFGEGRTLTSQHAEPDAQGNIAWYDVMFAEGIKRVSTDEIEVLVSETHMMHKKKKAK